MNSGVTRQRFMGGCVIIPMWACVGHRWLVTKQAALNSEVCFPKVSQKWYKTTHSDLRNRSVRSHRLRRCPIALQHNQV